MKNHERAATGEKTGKTSYNSSSQVALSLHPNFPTHSLRKTSGVLQHVVCNCQLALRSARKKRQNKIKRKRYKLTSFTNDHIESVLNKNCKNSKVNSIKRIFGGYSKYTYEVHLNEKPHIFQVWKEPDNISGAINSLECKHIYPEGIENFIKARNLLRDFQIRIPETIFIDSTKEHIPFDCTLNPMPFGNYYQRLTISY
jgi:hypothetical protein